jgi:hypothetical protein
MKKNRPPQHSKLVEVGYIRLRLGGPRHFYVRPAAWRGARIADTRWATRSLVAGFFSPAGPAVKYCAPQQLSNFEQDSCGSIGAGSLLRRPQAQETVMSEASEFRRYAEEALRWAEKSTTEKEKLSLMELARTWSQAAYATEHPMPVGVNYRPTDHRTAL